MELNRQLNTQFHRQFLITFLMEKSDVFVQNGNKVVLSGSSVAEREWAGVGFIISTRAHKSVVGFCHLNNRIASLRLKALGGIFVVVFPVYSPPIKLPNRYASSQRYTFSKTKRFRCFARSEVFLDPISPETENIHFTCMNPFFDNIS